MKISLRKTLSLLLCFCLCLCLTNTAFAEADTVTIPQGTKIVEPETFSGCTGITSVTIPTSVISIKDSAFYGCNNLKQVYYEGTQTQWNAIIIGSGNDSLNEASFVFVVDYPEQNILAICPWSIGGGTDKCLRAFCSALEEQLGVSVTVTNRSGAAGVIGQEAIAEAEPDGYTIGMITWELTEYLPMGMSDYTYENYIPICCVNTDASAISVNTAWAVENGISDLASFIDYCTNHPGEVKMGGSSSGSVWHVAGGYLMNTTGIDIQMVTYPEGSATAVRAAVQNEVNGVTVSAADVHSYVESGDLMILGIMDSMRNPFFPIIPTCEEQGYECFYSTHRGIAVPLGVDDTIVETLRSACAAAIRNPDFVKAMANLGQKISYMDGQTYGAYLAQAATDIPAAMEVLGLL